MRKIAEFFYYLLVIVLCIVSLALIGYAVYALIFLR